MKRRLHFNWKMKDCGQNEVLMKILKENLACQYGLLYKFQGACVFFCIYNPSYVDSPPFLADVHDREDFVNTVPLVTYEDLQPFLNTQKHNFRYSHLTSQPIVYLATSSGTSGSNKQLPLTSSVKTSANHVVYPLKVASTAEMGGWWMGRVVVLMYASKLNSTPCGLQVGPVTSHIRRHLGYELFPKILHSIHHEPTFFHLSAIFSLREPEVTSIETIFSTMVHSFFTHLMRHWSHVCESISRGRIIFPESMTSSYEMFEKEVEELDGCLRRDEKRGKWLESVLGGDWDGVALKVWSKLKYANMINTGCFSEYARVMRKSWLKGVKIISPFYAATEGGLQEGVVCRKGWVAREGGLQKGVGCRRGWGSVIVGGVM